MTTRLRLIVAAALLAAGLAAQPAAALNTLMCAPEQSVGSNQRQVTNPISGVTYNLNGQGCAVMAAADAGYFLTQGFSQQAPYQKIEFTTGVATGTTDFVIGSIPAGAFIRDILYSNATANAVTGGISIGTTANGTDVVAAQTCGANCLTFTTDALLLKRPFSSTVATPLHAAAVTAWASANVTITIIYGFY